MSDKPVLERLQVKAARTLAVLGADIAHEQLSDGVDGRAAAADADVVLVYLGNQAELHARLGTLPQTLRADVIL